MKKPYYLAPILFLSACAAAPTETLVLNPVASEPEVRVVKEPVYVIEPAAEPRKLAPTKSVGPVTATLQANKKSILMPKPENFVGSTLEYPVVDGYLYRVLASPNEITSIELPPGCRFHAKSPYIGDMRSHKESDQSDEEPNWEVVKSAHGGKDSPVAKVLVRPRIDGLKTTLHADTDCGPFRFKLEATANSANETVRFRKELSAMGFPETPSAEEPRADKKSENTGCDSMPVASATFAYRVSGSAAWAPHPNRIFHNGLKDGGKTCVKMSEALAADEYPAAFIPASGKEATVYSRITEGGYMEFDKVMPLIALRIGDETVRIELEK